MVGLFVVVVGCFMASICFSTAEQLDVQVRETLVQGCIDSWEFWETENDFSDALEAKG